MTDPDWLILRILNQSFEIERPKGHCSEVVVHLYVNFRRCFVNICQRVCACVCVTSGSTNILGMMEKVCTVLPTKSDSDVMFCL